MRNIKTITLLAFFASLIAISCKEEKKESAEGIAIISGKIENSTIDSIVLKSNREKIIYLDESGNFKDTIKLKTPGSYFSLVVFLPRTNLFLSPGDSLYVDFDLNDFDSTAKISGKGSEKNNYLLSKTKTQKLLSQEIANLHSLSPNEFKNQIKKISSNFEEELENSKADKDFLEIEKRSLNYNFFNLLLNYPDTYKFFNGSDVQLPDDFYSELKPVVYDDENDYLLIPEYKNLSRTHYFKEMGEDLENAEIVLKSIDSEVIKNDILKDFIYSISNRNEESQKFNNLIQTYSTDASLKQRAEKKYATIQNLTKGNPSPKFEYESLNGTKVSLDDLKGRVVYIDVWATWCKPCLGEIPSLKLLEQDYNSKNIEFVSISIDSKKDYNKWKSMVKELELKGIQLFADADWQSDFVQDYGIDGIPRFILIDTEGNIIDSDAPRPSSEEIREIINSIPGI